MRFAIFIDKTINNARVRFQIVQFSITSETFFGKIGAANNTVSDTVTTENVAFGMKKTSNNDSIESPMDFAYAMGLSRYAGRKPEKKAETISAPITAKLKYI